MLTKKKKKQKVKKNKKQKANKKKKKTGRGRETENLFGVAKKWKDNVNLHYTSWLSDNMSVFLFFLAVICDRSDSSKS